jgi:hypothetical protein
MGKSVHYTKSDELQKIAEELKIKYLNVIGYVEIDKIFFAYKGGDLPEWFTCEILGLQSEWVNHIKQSEEDAKMYCLALSYDYYTKIEGSLLQWTMLDLLYTCSPKMNGKMRRRNVVEHSRLLKTIEDLGHSFEWRDNIHLPELLGEETILFGLEEEDEFI